MIDEGDDDLKKGARAFLWKFAGTIALLILAISLLALLKLFEKPITPLRQWATVAAIFNGAMFFLIAMMLGIGLKQALSPPFVWRFFVLVLVGIAVFAGVYYAGLSFLHAQMGNEQSRPGGWTVLFLTAVPVIAILFALEDLLNHITRKPKPPDRRPGEPDNPIER